MVWVRIYTGNDGESHFEDMDMQPQDVEEVTKPTSGSITFCFRADGSFYDYHTVKFNHYAPILSGGRFEMETGDGTVRSFGPGDVVQAEDVTGRGHLSRVVGDVRFALVPMGEV